MAVALAGSAGARLLTVLNQALSSASLLNRLMRIALPDRPTPRVAGIDEFALLKGHRYATIITNAETGERVEVLPDRRKDTVVAWVREHPGIRMLRRDDSGGFAQAVREADSTIVQVSDRCHLWHGLTEAVLKEVGAHASCWAKHGPPLREDRRAVTTVAEVGYVGENEALSAITGSRHCGSCQQDHLPWVESWPAVGDWYPS